MGTAPATKLKSIERLGATIVKTSYEEAWKAVEEHASDRMTGQFVHPFDDDGFISGNGTIGLEILEDLPDVDAVIAPIGGGGLLAGIGCAIRALRPAAKVYAAEPATAAPLSASFAAGKPMRFEGWTASFVDGAGGKSVLPSMWPLLSQWVDASIVVSLEEAAPRDDTRRRTVPHRSPKARPPARSPRRAHRRCATPATSASPSSSPAAISIFRGSHRSREPVPDPRPYGDVAH